MINATMYTDQWDENPCRHPEHNPSRHRVFRPGEHKHKCPGCGEVTKFRVPARYMTRTSQLSAVTAGTSATRRVGWSTSSSEASTSRSVTVPS